MHIALTNSFPNLPHSAEMEFIARFKRSAKRLGHTAYEVVTSDDIHACEPDFVIATHDFTPKLTPHLTLGTLWNPPHFFQGFDDRVNAILSYDAHLIGSERVRAFLSDLADRRGVKKPQSDFLFLPSAPKREVAIDPDRRWDLVYVGVHWDGARHGGVFSALEQSGLLNVYGPPERWSHCPRSYRGQIPFDGETIFHVLSHHGIALCFHMSEHRRADTPSMRLFEAAAAGCVLISDEMPFSRRLLGDAALYVDLDAPEQEVSEAILRHVEWVRAHREEAAAMAAASHAIMAREHGLERSVEQCCRFAAELLHERGRPASPRPPPVRPLAPRDLAEEPKPAFLDVDVVLLADGHSALSVQRSVRAIAAQDGVRCRVLLVRTPQGGGFGSEAFPGSATEIIDIQAPAGGTRGVLLSAACGFVTAPFFAVLDAGDGFMPNHFRTLLAASVEKPAAGLFVSGVVRIKATGTAKSNFQGPLGKPVPEFRALFSLAVPEAGPCDLPLRPNAWMARSGLLDRSLLDEVERSGDPDRDLLGLLRDRAATACSFSPTAYWNDVREAETSCEAISAAPVRPETTTAAVDPESSGSNSLFSSPRLGRLLVEEREARRSVERQLFEALAQAERKARDLVARSAGSDADRVGLNKRSERPGFSWRRIWRATTDR